MLPDPQSIVDRLIAFQRVIRQTVIDSRNSGQDLHAVDRADVADTIYAIDAEVDPLLEAFCQEWSKTTPLVLVAEGMDHTVFPRGSREEDAAIYLLVDPIDGTRGLMYDKRSAWTLAGVAPNKGKNTRLADIEISVMAELPTSKLGQADVLWAIAGRGAHGVRDDLRGGKSVPLALVPSKADGILHGFASVVNFFPGTKVLAGRLMEKIALELVGPADVMRATVFDDQYISTGGQFYELVIGHDRFNADLRPLYYALQKQPAGLCCHPYDCAAWRIATEAGVLLTDGYGGPLDGPMDTISPISWAGYANAALRKKIEPILGEFLKPLGGDSVRV